MEAGAAGAYGGVYAVEAELFDGAAGAEAAGEGVALAVFGGGDSEDGVDGVSLFVADLGGAGEFLPVVLHVGLEVGFDLADVVVEGGEGGVALGDASHGAVAELREVEHGGVEVACFGEFPSPGDDFAGDGFEVAEAVDSEGAGVSAADGVVADLHALASGSEGLELAGEGAYVRHEAVEKIEGGREDAASHGDAAVCGLLGAEDGVGVWNEFGSDDVSDLLFDLGVFLVEVALVAEDGLAGGGVLRGEGGGLHAVASVVECDLGVVGDVAGASAGGDAVWAGLFVAGVVGPLAVVVDVGAELGEEGLVGGEEGILFEEAAGGVEGLAGLRVDADAAGTEGAGLGTEDALGEGEHVAAGGGSSADGGEIHGVAGLGEGLGEYLVAGPIEAVHVASGEAALAEVLHLGGECAGADLEVAVGEGAGVFASDDVAGVFGGAGLDAFGAVGFVHPGAGGVFLLAIEGTAGEEGVAEFVGFDSSTAGVEVDEDLGAFAEWGLHKHAGGSGSALGGDIGVVVLGAEGNEVEAVAEGALHGGEPDEVVGRLRGHHFSDISTVEFDIDEHARHIAEGGLLATLGEAGEAVHSSAEGAEGAAHGEHSGGVFVLTGIGGEEGEWDICGSTFCGTCGEGAGSAHGLDDGGIGELAHEGTHLRREGLIRGEAGGRGLDAHELAWTLKDFFENGGHGGIGQHGGSGGLVEAIGGVGRFAEDDLAGSGSGLDLAEHAEPCFVGGVEPGNGGADFWRGAHCGGSCGDTATDADIAPKGHGVCRGGDVLRAHAGLFGDDSGETLGEDVVAFDEAACEFFDAAGGLGTDDLHASGEAEGFCSGAEGDEVGRVGGDLKHLRLRLDGRLLLVASCEHAGEQLGGRGLLPEGLILGVDAFFLEVVFEFVVLQILFVGGTNRLIGISLLEPSEDHWVLRLGKQKLSRGLVDVFRLAFQSLLGPASELHGTKGSAADAGLERGGGFGESLYGREERGVEGIKGADKQASDGFCGELAIAGDFALGFEALLGGLLVEILVAGGSVGRVFKGFHDHFVYLVLSVTFGLVGLLKEVDFFGRVFTIFKLGNGSHGGAAGRKCPLAGDQSGRSCRFRCSACGLGRSGRWGNRGVLHRQLGGCHGIYFILGIFPVLKGGRIERDSICHWEVG